MGEYDEQQEGMRSYVSPEKRVPQFSELHSRSERPSITPEKLLRALLQFFYGARSERSLMKQPEYNLPFRWFVGLNGDNRVWDVTVFTKNRERLLDGRSPRSLSSK